MLLRSPGVCIDKLRDERGPRTLLFASDCDPVLPVGIPDLMDIPVYLPLPSWRQASTLLKHVGIPEHSSDRAAQVLFEQASYRGARYTSQALVGGATALLAVAGDLRNKGA